MNHISDLLAALGSHIGINDLSLNDEHVCRLELDKTLIIDIEHLVDSNTVQVYSVVGCDPGEDAAVLRRLLAANLFGTETGGAVLSLDKHRDEILLSHSFDLAITTPEKFVAVMDVFAGYVEYWTAELMEQDEASPQDEETPLENAVQNQGFIKV